MKKAFDSKKLSKPTNILRRVLSKTSNTPPKPLANTSKSSIESTSVVEMQTDSKEIKPTINVEAELLLLKQQINNLQIAVSSMQHDTEKKEVAIANLAREKERLASDLRKQQRSYTSLKQQLNDEREFYYKEKEQYCQEMNDCKRLKKTLKHGDDSKPEADYYKKEIAKLKEALTQALEGNYNLSVKFLRMKNTKYCLRNRLRKSEAAHENCIQEYNLQIEGLRNELVEVVDKELQNPIPPSNKKYLQIIKQNGMLSHENLCLRLEVDRLNLEIERLKMLQIQTETNSKLKYINSKTRSHSSSPDKERKQDRQIKAPKNVTINLNSEINSQNNQVRAVEELRKQQSQENISRKVPEKSSPPKAYEMQIKPDGLNITVLPVYTEKEKSEGTEKELIDTESNIFDVVQLSEKPSQTSSTQTSDYSSTSYKAIRTHSAPEIVQTSLFVNDT